MRSFLPILVFLSCACVGACSDEVSSTAVGACEPFGDASLQDSIVPQDSSHAQDGSPDTDAGVPNGDAQVDASVDSGTDATDSSDVPDAARNTPSDASDADSSEVVEFQTSDGGTLDFDLVSPSFCTTQLGHLIRCHIPTRHITAPSVPVPPPRITRISATQTGDCSTTVPIRLAVDAPGDEPLIFQPLLGQDLWFRARSGAAVSELTISNGPASWIESAQFDASCRIQVHVRLNELDAE